MDSPASRRIAPTALQSKTSNLPVAAESPAPLKSPAPLFTASFFDSDTTEAVVKNEQSSEAGNELSADPGIDTAPQESFHPAARIPIDLPPSATLSYEVRYATRGTITHGSGLIDWQASNDRYAIKGAFSKFGFTLSSFGSQGNIDDNGLVPTLYLEKNARRAETSTRFQRDASKRIVFSANSGTVALTPDAQDRASILWQLAGLARSGAQELSGNTRFKLLVAGVRDAQQWQIDVIGEEQIDVETGQIRAWHFVRLASPDTGDKRIDIWLAPDQQWYPVKLRYTEASGDYLDLSLAAIQ